MDQFGERLVVKEQQTADDIKQEPAGSDILIIADDLLGELEECSALLLDIFVGSLLLLLSLI